MARYINEDEFISWVREHWCGNCQNDNGLRCRACWIDDAIDIVEEAPEADVVPRAELAREIFEEIKKCTVTRVIKDGEIVFDKTSQFAQLKKKYTEEK